jgi:UDPglucose--hexose-1-phosphate uridylyltransferase
MTWEQRFHPLREEWVIVAAHRQERPWSGEMVGAEALRAPAHDLACYLCPGNVRVGGHVNPPYTQAFVFDNDLPCVGVAAPEPEAAPGFFQARRADGLARVVCYTPRHDLTLAELTLLEIERLLEVWQDQQRELAARPEILHVLVFENKGEVVGVSNPHPHCQIYATNFVMKTTEVELSASERHLASTGRVLFQDIVRAEREDGRRLLAENATALAFLPYFARFPYETFVAPKRTCPDIAALTAEELGDFARVLKDVLVRYDNLWQSSFPYVLALHQAPTDGRPHPAFHFHAELHPPLRKPGLKKFLAGPEIGAGSFLSDAAPEDKARELLAVSGEHYRTRP